MDHALVDYAMINGLIEEEAALLDRMAGIQKEQDIIEYGLRNGLINRTDLVVIEYSTINYLMDGVNQEIIEYGLVNDLIEVKRESIRWYGPIARDRFVAGLTNRR